MSQIWRSTLPLVMLAIALGTLDYKLLSFQAETLPIKGDGVPTVPKSSPRPVSEPPRSRSEFPLTLQRPVFFVNRKFPDKPKPVVREASPVVQVAPPAPPAAPPPPPIQIFGIVKTGPRHAVLVRSGAELQGTWLSVGDEYHGWHLREVSKDHVVVEAQGIKKELALDVVNRPVIAGPAPSAAQVAPPPPTAPLTPALPPSPPRKKP
jgi:type II secretory pathway component PulC